MADEKQLVVNLALKSGTMKQQINTINKEIKQIQTEFKNAGAGVEDFEKTSEGLLAKLKLQQSVVEKLKDKLSVYKQEQEKCTKTLDKAVDAYKKQEQKVKSLEEQLEEAKETYGENSEEVKKLEEELSKATKALDTKRNSVINANNSLTTMNTTISSTEAEIKAMESQINQTTSALDELENGSNEASDDVEELAESFDEASEEAITFAGHMSEVGQGLIDVGDKMGEAGKKILDVVGDLVETGSEYSAEVAGTEFLLKNLDSTTQEVINNSSELASTIGLTSKQYKDSATSIATYYKNMGITTEESNKLTGETMNLVADLAAITDMPFDDAMGRFKSGLMGNYEALDAFGINLSATTLENSEWVQSLGKSWNSLSDNEKMMAAYNEIVRQSSSATGLATQEAGEFGMQSKYLSERIEEVKGIIGEKLLPVLQPLIEKIADVVEKVAKWVEDNPELTRTILIIAGAIGGLMAVLGPIITTIGMLTIAVGAFNVAMLPTIGTIALVVAGIVALIAIVALVIAKWDEIVACWNSFCEWAKQLWSDFTNWISDKFTEIKDKTVAKIQEMKQKLIDKWNEIKTSVVNKITEMKEGIVNKFIEIKTNITNKINEIKTTLTTWGTTIKTTISNAFSTVYETITSPFKKAWSYISGIGDKISGVISKINPFKSLARSIDATITPSIDTYGIASLSLDNVALSGSYYNANSRASLNANDMIRQVNGSASGVSAVAQTSALDAITKQFTQELNNIKAENNNSINTLAKALETMSKAINGLSVDLKEQIVLENNLKANVYLDKRNIIKEIVPDLDKIQNRYNKLAMR